MMCAWIALSLLLHGSSSFMIYNTVHSRCLEDSGTSGLVHLRRCSLDAALQQWVWREPSLLESLATARCLSALHPNPVQTVPCEPGGEGRGLLWECEGNRLISQNSTLELSTDGTRLSLAPRGKESRWRSLEEGDICQERLRSRRASSEPEEFEVREGPSAGAAAMTEEQRAFLRWYYRTGDPTAWKFAMLGLSFAALLLGVLLLGMGSMANRNRKKIAKYKAAAALAQRSEVEELRVVVEQSEVKPTNCVQEVKGHEGGGEGAGLKAGDIMVTWKDGNVSKLYPQPEGEQEQKEEVEREEAGVEVKREEAGVEVKREEKAGVEVEREEEQKIEVEGEEGAGVEVEREEGVVVEVEREVAVTMETVEAAAMEKAEVQ